jgi:L-threonylcarbamoyladenylate synthase
MTDSNEISSYLAKNGAVAVLPTDTLYGLVARAMDPTAVSYMYGLKKRENKPGTLIAANIDQLEHLGLKRRYLKAVEEYWPGAVSVVIPCADKSLEYLHQGKQSLAVRIPDDKKLIDILELTGPLITSSANKPGENPAVTIEEARLIFGNKVGLYVDGGDLSKNLPSTVIRIIDDEIEVLRQGAVKI